MYIILLVGFLSVISGCKQKTEEEPVINSRPDIEIVEPDGIIGTWNWTARGGGITGEIFTPETEGYTAQLSLRSDGTYTSYKNFIEVNKGNFRLKDTFYLSYGPLTLFTFDNHGFDLCRIIRLSSDSTKLSIGGNICPDYIGNSYARLEQ